MKTPIVTFGRAPSAGLKCWRWSGPRPIFRTDSKQTLEWRVHTQFCLKLQLLSLLVANAHPKGTNGIKLELSISCTPCCLNINSLLLSVYHKYLCILAWSCGCFHTLFRGVSPLHWARLPALGTETPIARPAGVCRPGQMAGGCRGHAITGNLP